MKKYGLPFIILVVGSFLLHLIRENVSFTGKDTLLAVLMAVLAFMFGACLNSSHSSRGDTWVKKMIVMFLFIFMVLVYLNVIRIGVINQVLGFIGFTDKLYCLLFVWLGFLFFC